jgi:glycosyltransferase involved in cell wall biosynthesis
MKILISAYSCAPNSGSEPGIGWQAVREAAERHEVWVLTRPDESRVQIEQWLAANPLPNVHFHYFTTPLIGWLWRRFHPFGMYIHYYLWQIVAYLYARKLHAQVGFDLVHHATFGRYTSPSFVALLPVPFVWGPVGGGESAPWRFWKDFRPKAFLYELARSAQQVVGNFDPFTRLTARRSRLALATTPDTARCLDRIGSESVRVLPNVGLWPGEIARLEQTPPPPDGTFRFISIGRILHWKGLHLGLRAFAALGNVDAEYWIVGDGPEEAALKQLAAELQLGERVKFLGRLGRNEVFQRIADSHVLLHPALHDSGGFVCIEAMAAGRPVVCLKLGGPAELVSEDCGLAVPAIGPQQAIRDLTIAMRKVLGDRAWCAQLAQCGRRRVREHFDYARRGSIMDLVYRRALAAPATVTPIEESAPQVRG